MKTIFTFLVVLIATMLISCNKIKQRSVTGQIIDAGTKAPVANTRFKLNTTDYGSDFPKSNVSFRNYDFITDSKGRFMVLFDAENGESASIGENTSTFYWSETIGKKEYSFHTGVLEYLK